MNAEQEKILNLLYDEPYKIGHFTGFKDLTVLHNEWLLDRAGFKPKDEIELTKPVDETIKEMSEYFERRAREDT